MCPLQPLEADGAEEEDGVEQHQTESKPAVQPPVVQMDTENLGRDRPRERENLIQDKLNFLSHSPKYNLKLKTKKYFSGSENRIKGLSGLNGKKIKIIGEEK